ncbi:hypothetical protein CRT38_05029 [Anaplasma phagocytophilum str. CRT38]|uniref:Uncharacterized protein n=1 Tax=Anaplasma phagocytophilum str. CRT38 TaxID=1269275 RepID=S7XT88_ANAPH|nr:hypothetical protein CRT38_05029 [Anaplasma phagocytophilum str. CRT38]
MRTDAGSIAIASRCFVSCAALPCSCMMRHVVHAFRLFFRAVLQYCCRYVLLCCEGYGNTKLSASASCDTSVC